MGCKDGAPCSIPDGCLESEKVSTAPQSTHPLWPWCLAQLCASSRTQLITSPTTQSKGDKSLTVYRQRTRVHRNHKHPLLPVIFFFFFLFFLGKPPSQRCTRCETEQDGHTAPPVWHARWPTRRVMGLGLVHVASPSVRRSVSCPVQAEKKTKTKKKKKKIKKIAKHGSR